ncbi:MAG: hypothetical protein DELT_03131 [Desulfovibrio sp.]
MVSPCCAPVCKHASPEAAPHSLWRCGAVSPGSVSSGSMYMGEIPPFAPFGSGDAETSGEGLSFSAADGVASGDGEGLAFPSVDGVAPGSSDGLVLGAADGLAPGVAAPLSSVPSGVFAPACSVSVGVVSACAKAAGASVKSIVMTTKNATNRFVRFIKFSSRTLRYFLVIISSSSK